MPIPRQRSFIARKSALKNDKKGGKVLQRSGPDSGLQHRSGPSLTRPNYPLSNFHFYVVNQVPEAKNFINLSHKSEEELSSAGEQLNSNRVYDDE
ncbi:hypothetical protein DHB64_18375, partial [Antarcticibacterium sp. W02-3]|uniref:hypothetical protein n=1 Tax=Antarcticibacterium sp. W02-3 TaxID=2183747 RepID=UPI002044C203